MEKLIRVDKNGTKYFEDTTCPNCGGSGVIPYYYHVESGRCFRCNGTGYSITKWREYTPEYTKKLAERRLKKARKTSGERNKAFYKKVGFSEEGDVWVVLGDTYSIRDELKSKGAKYIPVIGWHFDHEVDDYPCFKLTKEDTTYEYEDYSRDLKMADELRELVELHKKALSPKMDSEFVGEVGKKVEVRVNYICHHRYKTHYTYHGEVHYIYKFKDENGNILIWNTSSYPEIEEGESYILRGTVKEHKEYKGDKETILSRCKIS